MRSIKNVYEHLFEQLDRLSAAQGDELKQEIDKSHAMINVSQQILTTAETEANIIAAVQNLGTGFVSAHEIEETPKLPPENGKLYLSDIEDEPSLEVIKKASRYADENREPIEEDGNGIYLTEEKKTQQNKLKKNQNRL